MSVPLRHDLVAVMAENRRAFLSFLERRVGHRETAEDLLQDSFARSLEKVPLEAEESVTAWFYRVLRNGVIDHYRRMGVSDRALSSLQRELEEETQPSPDERDAVCRCVSRLSETLKSEYALALRRVEVDGLSVQAFASEADITPNNAAVRLFRARETLRKRVVRWCGSCAERGCVDCTCGESGSTGCSHPEG
jgi:RNA polymerase sigma factor (sigma-70 family)